VTLGRWGFMSAVGMCNLLGLSAVSRNGTHGRCRPTAGTQPGPTELRRDAARPCRKPRGPGAGCPQFWGLAGRVGAGRLGALLGCAAQ
jgi:hypothetical protein